MAIAVGQEPQDHKDFPRNYRTGSSKSMEATMLPAMVVQLHALVINIEFVVSGDDITMRAHLHHIGAYKGGKLPLDIPEISFLWDSSHCINVMVKDIFALNLSIKVKSEYENIYALRLEKGNWSLDS